MKGSNKMNRVLVAILAAVIVVLAFMSLQGGKTRDGYSAEVASPVDFSRVVDMTMPSLVKVENEALTQHPALAGMKEEGAVPQMREGTGFFIDRDGLILTNYHVVDGAQELKVVTHERKVYPAEIVGADAFTDVALIKIKPDFKVTPVVLGDSDRLKVGQWVMALGNPLGLEFLASAGIISGFGPPGPNYIGFYNFIQVDLAINPGNSGGPLLNTAGEVVGINNAYAGPGTGIGFAIPINRAKEVVSVIRKEGRISRGFLGIISQPLTAGLAERLGLGSIQGALVSDVLEEGPAKASGLKAGDVILEFGGRPVKDDRELVEDIYTSPAGTGVKLLIVRSGKKMDIPVTLGELQAHSLITQRIIRQCGLTLKEVPPEMADRLGLKEPVGLVVLKVVPGCPAYEGGLRFGDVITRVEKSEIRTVSDFYREYSQMKPGSQVMVQVFRGGRPMFITIRQGERQ